MAPAYTWIEEWRPHGWALAAYVLVAILFAWPLPRHLRTHLPGSPDGDTGVYVWNLWVFQHELIDQRTLPYFTGRIFAATGRANLGLHNYTTFANLLALPLVRFVGVVATFNVVYLMLTILTAYAVFALAWHLTRDGPVAWLAGVLFAWSPVMVTRGMGHFSLVAAAPLATFVLLLIRSNERKSVRDTVGLGVTVAWATACDVYYGVFCVMLATAYLCATSLRFMRSEHTPTGSAIAFTRAIDVIAISVAGLVLTLLVSQGFQFTLMGRLVRVRTIYTPVLILTILVGIRAAVYYRPGLRTVPLERIAASVRMLATAGVISAILMSPLLYAVTVRLLEDRGDRTPIFWRSSPPGIDVLALVTPNPNHPLMPAAVGQSLAHFTRDGYLENVASIPFIAMVTLIVACWIGWRPPAFAAAIALGFGLLALGPFIRIDGVDTHVPGPWALIRYLPIIGLARSPSRFFVFAMLGIALLFATALRAILLRWPRARVHLLISTGVLLAAELLPAPRILFSAEIPRFYRTVAEDPRADARVLELPFGLRDGRMAVGNFTSRTQFHQTAHGKPIIGGYLSRVSQRRMRDNVRHPVLGAFIRLSEGKELAASELDLLRAEWPAFVRRTMVGYVVVDRERASDQLKALAEVLQLETLAEEGSLTLFQPSTNPH